jgi:hypothetical protein
VINFFSIAGGIVVNFGGLNGSGNANIPLTVNSSTQFTFQAPPGSESGPAYVMALNPPFIPFTSTTGDPQGAFSLGVP